MVKKSIKIFLLILASAFCFSAAACGSVKTDEDHSPQLVNASITSYNEGSESRQYVQVTLEFDRAVAVKEKKDDSLRMTVGGERVQSDEYEIAAGEDENTAVITISVTAVTTAILKIQKSEKSDYITDITDETGKYAAADFSLEGTIPSGMTLTTVSKDVISVIKEVSTPWSIRSIAWVCLTKNGEVIPVEEDDANEEFDGRVAVHGHEFLSDDKETIAKNIAQTLSGVYPSQYSFTYEDNRVRATAVNAQPGDYDIVVYEYLKINGVDIPLPAEADGDEETTGVEEPDDSGEGETSGGDDDEEVSNSKVKVTEINRDVAEEEREFLNKLHISEDSGEDVKDGEALYQTITITGDAMPEEEIYSVRDLEGLIEISFENEAMNAIGLPVKTSVSLNGTDETVFYGLDLLTFLGLCGVDTSTESLYMSVETAGGGSETLDLADLIAQGSQVLLVFGSEDGPLWGENSPVEGAAALLYVNGEETHAIGNVYRLTLGEEEEPGDPYYRFHNREPWLESLDKTFAVEVYKKGSEYLGALIEKTFTTEEFEELVRENPEHVVRNYYGVTGIAETYSYLGTGDWLDFYEGLDLRWLLTEQVGLDASVTGYAELYGRDEDLYGQIDDLAYIFGDADPSEYYVLTSDGYMIPCSVPMIACTKNGYPVLPEHIHEGAGYIAYNYMNDRLEELGIETEIGVVKNHKGPFNACLGNLDGYYGGVQIETAGDCVLIKIFVD